MSLTVSFLVYEVGNFHGKLLRVLRRKERLEWQRKGRCKINCTVWAVI